MKWSQMFLTAQAFTLFTFIISAGVWFGSLCQPRDKNKKLIVTDFISHKSDFFSHKSKETCNSEEKKSELWDINW